MTQSLDFSKIQPLSEDQIDQHSYNLKDLWMIHYQKKIYGPYHLDLVQEIALKFTSELELSSACNLARGKWYYLFDNKEFQNRHDQSFFKPVVITDEPLLIYSNEKEYGPYDLGTLVKMLKKRQIKHSDLFSIDSGASWKKVYEIDGLDRRQKSEDQLKLPEIPDMEAYSQEQLQFLKKGPNNHNIVLELKKIEPISVKSKRTSSPPLTSRARSNTIKPSSSRSSTKQSSPPFALVVFVVVILAGLAWLMRSELSHWISSNDSSSLRSTKRRVSQYQLQAKKRKKPRIRLIKENQETQRTAKTREIRQKEYRSDYEDTLKVNNSYETEPNDETVNEQSRSNRRQELTVNGLDSVPRRAFDEVRDAARNSLGSDYSLDNGDDQDIFLRSDLDEPVDIDDIQGEYILPNADYSDLPSDEIIPIEESDDIYYDNEDYQ